MKAAHNYITRIDVHGLWGRYDLTWNLTPRVNVLSGFNGSGKSTTLYALARLLRGKGLSPEDQERLRSLAVTFEDGTVVSSADKEHHPVRNVDIVSTFDSHLKDPDALRKLTEGVVRTEIDWEIYRVQKRYITYQLAQGKKMIALLGCHAPAEEVEAVNRHKELFFDRIDALFAQTGKRIDRASDELAFLSADGRKLTPYMLSSGEKQLLLILTTVLTQDNAPAILLMDEPDISMHFDWQTGLIDHVLELNPHAQLIAATHSPALVMNGWMDAVSEVSDLLVDKSAGHG